VADEKAAFIRQASETGATVETPKELAQAEFASRELSRRRLLPFVKRFLPGYEAGWVHKDICEKLEKFSQDVRDKKSPRLMLFMPPRHGKSELASRNFPAWHLGHCPKHEVIAVSYSASLALKFSRKVRSLLCEPGYEQLFPETKLSNESQSIENWMTTQGGSYMAAGISGPLTGNGMHIGIIDDPVKNREEAESENVRATQKDWYTSTFYTRLAPGAGILIILTRWHHDDLAGWLLREQERDGDHWDVVIYPAEAEQDEPHRKKGEPLHAARYNSEALARIRRAVGPRDWQALYQQQPTSDEGDYFQKSHFRYYTPDDQPPLEELSKYTAWDLAIGKGQSNDWTVGITVGIDQQDKIWILDVCRGRWDGLEICDQMLDVHQTWQTERVGIEHGQISMSIWPLLQRRIQERNMWDYPFDPKSDALKTGRRDKEARARAIQGRMRQGMVLFPNHAPWTPSLVSELLSFPAGVHDDQVDALAWIGQMLMMFSPAVLDEGPQKASWKDKLDNLSKNKLARSRSAMGA
jgi:predicted phage terminase large subunit-like protein